MEWENNSFEKNEKNENYKNKVNKLSLQNMSSDYIKAKLSEDIDYFEKIKSENYYDDFIDFIDGQTIYEENINSIKNFGDIEKNNLENKIKLDSIREKIWIDKNISTAKKIIKEEFKIKNDRLLDKGLKETYKWIHWRENIKKILKNKINRHAFLATFLKWKYEEISITKHDSIDETLSNIKWLNIDELATDQLVTLKKIYNSRMILDSKDLIVFLSLLNFKNRYAILKELNPTLNLKQLIELWVITETKAIEKLKTELKNTHTKLSKSDINKIFNESIEFDNIFISIHELNEKQQINFINSNKAVKNMVDELNEARQKIEKEESLFLDDDLLNLETVKIKNWEYETKIHNNFIDFIKEDYWKNLTKKIKDTVDSFKKWGYIKLNDTKWNKYFYIEEIDLGWTKSWKHIKVRNLNSLYWIQSIENSPTETITYENLYKIILNLKNVNKGELEFLNEKDFKTESFEKAPEENNLQTEEDLRKILYKDWFLSEDSKNLDFTQLKFKDKNKGVEFYRSFSSFNNNKHELTFKWSWQIISYSEFLNEFRKSNQYKLEHKINNLQELLEKSNFLKDNNIVLHNSWNKLVTKSEKNNANATEIKTFLWDNWNTITINKVSDNSIKYSTWKVQSIKNTEKKWKIYNIKNDYLFDTFDDFLLKIDNSKSNYKSLEKWQEIEDNDAVPIRQKSTIFGKLFTLSSIVELIQWTEVTINALKEYLERWNDLKSAKFAQLFWKVLPDDIQAKLEFSLTEKKKESIDKIFKELTEADWGPAMKRITERIIANKNASSEEVYASMKFMLMKRGGLYAKDLAWKEKDFIWYQKLWWKKGDAFYMKYKLKIEKQNNELQNSAGKSDPVFFTEEWLIEDYLKKYQQDTNLLYPRVEKDFQKYLTEGQSNRYKKWEDEWGYAFTISEKLNLFNTHLATWEKSRALWVLSKIFSKNSTFESLYAPWFIIAMSWVAEQFNWSELNHLMWFSFETPSTALLFAVDSSWIEIYQNALINFYENTGKNQKAKKLKKILALPINKRIWELNNFWIENKNDIMNFYNLKDGYIILNKGTKKDKWGFFESMYQIYKWSMASSEYSVVKWDFLGEWQYDNTPMTDTNNKLVKIESTNSWGYKWSESRRITRAYINRLEEIKKMDIPFEDKKKLFINIYNSFEWGGEKRSGITEALWQYISKESIKDWQIYRDLKFKGLLVHQVDHSDMDRNDFLDKAFNEFINHNVSESPADNIIKEIKTSLTNYLPENN